MAQLQAARSAADVKPTGREVKTANRAAESFASVLQNARRIPRQRPEAAGGQAVDARQPRPEQPARNENPSGQDRPSRPEPAVRADEPGRVDRLREGACEERPAGQDEQDADFKAADAPQEVGRDRLPAERESPAAQMQREGTDPQEMANHEPKQQESQSQPQPAQKLAAEIVTSGAAVSSDAADPVRPAANAGGSGVHVPGPTVPVPQALEAAGGPVEAGSTVQLAGRSAGQTVPPVVSVMGIQPAQAATPPEQAAPTQGMVMPPQAGPTQGMVMPPQAGPTQGMVMPPPEAKPAPGAATPLPPAKPAQRAENNEKPAGQAADFLAAMAQAGPASPTTSAVRPGAVAAGMPAGVAGETVKLDGPEGAQDLARVVRANMGARHSSMTLRLDPPELGAVRVDVRMHDAAMTVRFQAQTEAGCDALQGRLRELAGALEGQGIRLDRVEVEYRPPPPPDAPRDDQGYARQQSGQQWGEPRFTGGQGRSDGWQSPASLDYSAETRGGGTRELESDGVQLDKMGVNVVI